jgi:DNA-binding NtrC family response regulator
MRAAPADAIGPASDPVRDHLARRGRRTQEPAATVPPPQPKIAERPARSSVQRLLHLTDALLRETETLARDKAYTDESNRIRTLNFAEGIDFYSEVERFETGLIRLALDQTGGHQARAAQLLRIKPSTLNSKIKLYGIEY